METTLAGLSALTSLHLWNCSSVSGRWRSSDVDARQLPVELSTLPLSSSSESLSLLASAHQY